MRVLVAGAGGVGTAIARIAARQAVPRPARRLRLTLGAGGPHPAGLADR
ncbi:MAG: hypothetical protein J2P34_10445 [Actinobacteria bacterium]|nr:hypothetical protein [Actinomycetota bacterium]